MYFSANVLVTPVVLVVNSTSVKPDLRFNQHHEQHQHQNPSYFQQTQQHQQIQHPQYQHEHQHHQQIQHEHQHHQQIQNEQHPWQHQHEHTQQHQQIQHHQHEQPHTHHQHLQQVNHNEQVQQHEHTQLHQQPQHHQHIQQPHQQFQHHNKPSDDVFQQSFIQHLKQRNPYLNGEENFSELLKVKAHELSEHKYDNNPYLNPSLLENVEHQSVTEIAEQTLTSTLKTINANYDKNPYLNGENLLPTESSVPATTSA